MKSFTVNDNDAGQRLDKFVTKAVPRLPQSMLYKYIRTKRIKINGRRGEISTRLQTGDVIEMYINEEFFEPVEKKYDFMSASKKLDILYEDENILLLDKKVGLLCHPDDSEYTDTLIARVERYLFEKGEYEPDKESSFTPALANRIDRNTGGIVIAAKNAESLRILNQKIKDREVNKTYLCLAHGHFDKPRATLTAYLWKDEKKNKVTVSASPVPDAKKIRTRYEVLDEKDKLSLVRVELLTGRTHQIRAHFAFIGHPLLGDGKYGTNALNKEKGYKKQCLYSYRLQFAFTTDAGLLNYLDGQHFEAKTVWFVQAFYNGTL